MFETLMSGYKKRQGEIGLKIRPHASPKVGQGQVSGEVGALCWQQKKQQSVKEIGQCFYFYNVFI